VRASAARRAAAARLREAGVASPERDADLLLSHLLDVPLGRLPLVDDLGASQVEQYDALVARRATREPLQHLTGIAAFRHVEVVVGPGAFVPRPETELLAGWAVDEAHLVTDRLPVVVDLCTGSGAIAAAVKDEVPHADVHAVEVSPEAFRYAQANLADVDLRLGDAFEAFDDLAGSVDVVVCNPPYIPLEAWESVAPEARDHDPHLALFSGADGLDAMRRLERRAAILLRPGGVVGAEHADAQGDSAPAVFAGTGRWREVRDHLDLAGRPRYVTARLAR
jgi:release factor glutamine methyltransferase